MNKLFPVFAVLMLSCFSAMAAPGDTTKVQAHFDKAFTHYGNFDSTVEFPDGTKPYRKIMMTFTLGRYACPGSEQYCGDWDYTVQTLLMTKTGDTLELGRLITPYAGDGWPRTSVSWKQRYEFDVTDFYPLLKDSATIRVHYSGYSWGFTGNIRFDFIEGTPPRNVLGIDRLWHGSYGYGGTTPIDDNVTSFTKTAPANTQFSDMKFIITGHGADNDGCSEFCKKYYRVNINKALGQQVDIWRADCGYNHMYPQNGTWVHDRGNWCPGDKVFANVHPLGITGGSTYEVDVDFEAYTRTGVPQGGSAGSYIIGAAVFYYGGYNKATDVSLDDIIAPNNHETHFRQNPAMGRPMVTVTNTGGSAITSIKFKYEMVGGSGMQEYTWQGSLDPLKTTNIEFPLFYDFRKATGTANVFNVTVEAVNGAADDDATNNTLSSVFKAAKTFPMTIVVEMFTNSATVAGISENSWKIIELFSNTVVAQRNNCAPTTTYSDTVNLTVGMYKLVAEDAGCDGLDWWANRAQAGRGTLKVFQTTSVFPLQLDGYFDGDFGCGFTQCFNVDWPAAITEIQNNSTAMSVYPNPAQTEVTISLHGVDIPAGVLQLKDITGKTVAEQPVNSNINKIDLSGISNGVYMLEYINAAGQDKIHNKVIISR